MRLRPNRFANSHRRERYSQFRFAPLRITWRGDLRRYTPFRYAELRITADIQNFFPQTLRDVLQ